MKTDLQKIAILLAMLLGSLAVSADTFYVDGLWYGILGDSEGHRTCEVISSACEGDELIIPSEVEYHYKKYSVISIGNNAFQNCDLLNKIIIPNSVTKIGYNAFSRCSSLTQIIIPNSVTEIGEHAFSGCTSLEQVTIPNSVTEIGERAFWGCSELISIIIPYSVTELGEFAFGKCSKLETVKLSDNLTTLRLGVFSGCTSLKSLNIPGKISSMELGSLELRWKQAISYGSLYYQQYVSDYSSLFDKCDSLQEIRFEYSNNSIKATRYRVTEQKETFEEKQYWEKIDLNMFYYKLKDGTHGNYYEPYEVWLPIERIFIDRSLPNSLTLPNLKELILGEHIYDVDIKPLESDDLRYIECHAINPPYAPSFTSDQYMNVVLRVPEQSLDVYKSAPIWKNFKNIESIESAGIDTIEADKNVVEIGRYNVNGQRVDNDYNGLVIIRYSDGSTRKIFSNN